MEQLAHRLASAGWTLRTGGADTAFENGHYAGAGTDNRGVPALERLQRARPQ